MNDFKPGQYARIKPNWAGDPKAPRIGRVEAVDNGLVRLRLLDGTSAEPIHRSHLESVDHLVWLDRAPKFAVGQRVARASGPTGRVESVDVDFDGEPLYDVRLSNGASWCRVPESSLAAAAEPPKFRVGDMVVDDKGRTGVVAHTWELYADIHLQNGGACVFRMDKLRPFQPEFKVGELVTLPDGRPGIVKSCAGVAVDVEFYIGSHPTRRAFRLEELKHRALRRFAKGELVRDASGQVGEVVEDHGGVVDVRFANALGSGTLRYVASALEEAPPAEPTEETRLLVELNKTQDALNAKSKETAELKEELDKTQNKLNTKLLENAGLRNELRKTQDELSEARAREAGRQQALRITAMPVEARTESELHRSKTSLRLFGLGWPMEVTLAVANNPTLEKQLSELTKEVTSKPVTITIERGTK